MEPGKTKIVFMGTPQFAVPSLQILHDGGFSIVGVITAPDRKGGRGRKKTITSAVKKYAIEHDLTLLQPTNLKSPAFLDQLASLQADLQVVVAFRMLPKVVWSMPPLGTINLHGSLLPAYRGAAPINWAIIKGEQVTGLTTFFIQKEIDTGHILEMQPLEIDQRDTAGTLHDRMMHVGAQLVHSTVVNVINGRSEPKHQDHSLATKAPKIYHQDCRIDFSRSAKDVYNFIRGLSPYPGAWTRMDGKQLKIFWVECTEMDQEGSGGSFATDGNNRLFVKSKDDWLEIKEVQMEGRRKMSVEVFLRGYNISTSEIKGLKS